MFEKLKNRWQVKDNFQFWVIFLVFAITGSSAAKLTGPILKASSWIVDLPYWQYAIFYVIATLVVYQFLLVFFGWIFGEFNFFWNFVKRILRRIGVGFLFKA
ncbi:MAG TPA: diacylglyceryl transferase [Flavobacteriaceae bacterium]|nr:diacylglyceryl transferase [Flavobacteriaceae bacterium]MCB9213402.1 diacylglyceryl transferase [Alteromonas sp.]HPF10295.1 diacylglyceryl transferase [Flavobacteriaceae bacterium]HQU20741.1 diacylglyceryl transferase [Flavobacteriaceae bacterium]HQU64841.1 diacylglyceryl transferase [Flavobacteriaceae bacterium]